jgi:membrane-bound lytic murein transglycosylase D
MSSIRMEAAQSPKTFRHKTDFAALLAITLPQLHIDPAQVPGRFRKRLVEYLQDYTIQHRAEVQGMLARAALHITMIRLILQEQGLPWYYGYLPFVESAFHIDAVHPKSGAAGLWQLMPFTAQGYGLRITKSLDERLEPVRATRAAAGYLRELQDMFGATSPLLLLAAYNYGENNLSKAITRARTRNIWTLYTDRHLPYQTREYLVKVVAFWIIVVNADTFHFTLDEAVSPAAYTEVTLSQSVSLASISRQIDMPLAQLRALNPHLLTEQVPTGAPIRLPAPDLHTSVRIEVRLTSSESPGQAQLLLMERSQPTVQQNDPELQEQEAKRAERF